MSNFVVVSTSFAGEDWTKYGNAVAERIDAVTSAAAKRFLAETQRTAPMRSGYFHSHIALRRGSSRLGYSSFVWYVKAPSYRLTHLLENDHAGPNGSRVRGRHFVQVALLKEKSRLINEIKEVIESVD